MEITTPNESESDWDLPLGDPHLLLLAEFFQPTTLSPPMSNEEVNVVVAFVGNLSSLQGIKRL